MCAGNGAHPFFVGLGWYCARRSRRPLPRAKTCTCYSMCMATLDRRVQVLFDPAVYALLEAEAVAERESVAAVIRDAVNERLNRRRVSRSEALDRLLASADSDGPPVDWQAEKRSFDPPEFGERD